MLKIRGKIITAALRDVCSALLEANFNKIIDDEEFLLLWYLNEPKNIDYPYWNTYFDLDNISTEKCWTEFRFKKDHLFELREVLRIPEEIVTHNRRRVDGMEALCILLKEAYIPLQIC